jgi:FkbM family methyltransferase
MALQGLVRRILDKCNIEIQRLGTLANFFQVHSIDLVVDVGANLGQFAASVRSKGYKGRVISYEPIPDVFDSLQRRAENDRQWSTVRTALGDCSMTAQLNVHGNHTLSSFLNYTKVLEAYDTGSAVQQKNVEVRRLDELLADDVAQDMFLKIDVQGFERQVLDGAKGILSRVSALYVELPVENLYQDSWSFREAIDFIDDLGFEPAQFRMVNPRADDRSSAVEFDALFRRKI